MEVNIEAVGFKASAQLQEFVESKLGKLVRLEEGIESAQVYLRLQNGQEERKESEIKLRLKGGELFAKKQANTFEEATDDAVDALKSQLATWKGKKRS